VADPLLGPTVESFSVGAWCPTPDGSGKPTAVAFTLSVSGLGDLVMRLKSPERVDEIVRLLLQYKQEVWPKPTTDGQHRHRSKF
jgi:hypothetical protein